MGSNPATPTIFPFDFQHIALLGHSAEFGTDRAQEPVFRGFVAESPEAVPKFVHGASVLAAGSFIIIDANGVATLFPSAAAARAYLRGGG